MDRATAIDQLRAAFKDRPGIVAAYLFGSVARDEARPSSDVDIGVILAQGRPRNLEELVPLDDLREELALLVGREVDLVPMNEAHPELLHRILRDGVLLHETDHAARVNFEVQARNEYWDLLPILEHYRRTVLENA
ncbi:MAG: nucleotidyltransferase domain-containing protein [Planctomycetes bacterium]|nr:nucleotidyltransferase domain-containing protein [Planctomycetota bacterium]